MPPECIAHAPLGQRDASRLMVRASDGGIQHRQFSELADVLPHNTLLVVNDSKVIPARINGVMKGTRAFELLLLEPVAGSEGKTWHAIGRPTRHFTAGSELNLGDGVVATLGAIPRGDSGGPQPFEVHFNVTETQLFAWLDRNGYIPLPPYIERSQKATASDSPDRERYQTVYADQRGSVAAPTAGLHFTPELMGRLGTRGIKVSPITLHVGGGTFLPVKCHDLNQHLMHKERYLVPKSTVEDIQQARDQGRPIVVVGTTSFRCLEAFWHNEKAPDEWHTTDIFIRPKSYGDRYRPKIASGLITNFHQPGSTLVMLIAALIGLDAVKTSYQTAISAGYRFLSYGDSNLFWLDGSN